jgi:hypothetical protein
MLGLATADVASAKDVVLWVCHGPAGQPLGAAPLGGAAIYGGGCTAPGTSLGTGGVRATPGRSFSLIVPPFLRLEQVHLKRGITGLGREGGSGRYSATFSNEQLTDSEFDGSPVDVSGSVSPAIATSRAAGSITVKVTREGAAADVQSIGLRVADDAAPTAAAGGYGNQASGVMPVAVWAKDYGVGLARAEVRVDDGLVASGDYVDDTGGAHCKDMTPGDGTVDLPLDNDCLANGRLTLPVDTNRWSDGDHRLTILLYDAAGNVTEVLKDYVFAIVNHPNLGSNTATLNIGSANTPQTPGAGGPGGGRGGVAGATSTSCNSPKLSMELSQKPEKLSKGVPVLQHGKRYRFRGRLTCVAGGKRRSAAARTPIELLNTIGRKTYRKGGATVRANGAITIILAYKSSRTLVFRYTNPDGRRSQVKLEIQIAKTP